MFRNFLIITFRNLIRNRSFSLLSILGLTTGLAVFSAIALYIQHEFSYEKNHENLDRLYRVEQFRKDKDVIQNLCGTPPPLSMAIVADIPQIERSTPFILNTWNTITTSDQRKIRETNVGYAGADFFEMFSVKRIAGDPDGGFTKPFMAAITREIANKYFGDENPIGKTLKVGQSLDIEIRTVVENIPDITHLKFNILISFPTLREQYGDEVVTNDWYSNWVRNYVMVAENADILSLNQKLKNYLKKYQGDKRDNELYLKPLSKIHLYSTVVDETAQTGDIKNIYIYSAIGIFIIIIACINFINLTTAFSSDRAKEIAVKKTTGASKKLLLSQFLGESIIISLISMHLSLILLEAFLPYFNMVVNRHLVPNYFGNWMFTCGLLGVTIVIGFLSGFYPAVYLSSFQPVKILGGLGSKGSKNPFLRRILVVFQFFISVTLIICTILVLKQLDFMKNKDLGFDKDHIVIVNLPGSERSKAKVYRNEILKYPGVLKAGTSDYLPMSSTNWTGFSWEGAQEGDYIKMNINYVDENFIDTYGMTLVDGRTFTSEMANSDKKWVLINETAVNKLNWKEEAIGKKIFYSVDYRNRENKEVFVAGVVKDYHFMSKHYAITPLIMPLINDETSGSSMSIKIMPVEIDKTIVFLEETYKKVYNESVWNYSFADDILDDLYREESKMSSLVLFFALLAIFIASLGLFGLISCTTRQRTKEIGIRKVFGTPVRAIMFIISKEFIILLGIANLLAWPVAFYGINKWLLNFQYQSRINIWAFLIAALLSLIIAQFTVGFRVVKAANTNPADSLRYE